METLPMTEADGATKLLDPPTAGAMPSTAMNRVEGTNLSVYLATSTLAPKPSNMALKKWKKEDVSK
jgi:hypothetical protein